MKAELDYGTCFTWVFSLLFLVSGMLILNKGVDPKLLDFVYTFYYFALATMFGGSIFLFTLPFLVTKRKNPLYETPFPTSVKENKN